MQIRRHRFPRTALLAAGSFAAAAALWMPVGVPTVVKYPTDLDISPRYEGSFILFVDPTTTAPLDEPTVLPLTVERRIQTVPDESGASKVLVRETIHQQAGDLIDTTQTNVYVMDRSTLENVDDDRAYAFQPENHVDRSGSYRLNLPFDTSRSETYDTYKNEIDATYTLRGDPEVPTIDEQGLHLSNFTALVEEAPLSPAYLAELNEVVPLPDALTLDQLKPHLLAAGIDVDGILAALTPVITPEDLATLATATGSPIPLTYVLSFDGHAAVDPVTGAEVHVRAGEAVGARPELTMLPTLEQVLGHYPDVPEAVAAITALDALADAPAVRLFEYRYDQTTASVAEVADEVTSLRRQVLLARVWLPLGLALAAAATLLIGFAVWARRHPTPPAPEPKGPAIDLRSGPQAEERERVGAS